MISIILPTRKRFKYLQLSIESLVSTCSNKSNLEILLLFDDDDRESIDQFLSWENKNFNYKYIISPRLGYRGMHIYNNMLADISSGSWLFLWNDDSRMKTQNWDTIILDEYKDQFIFLSPKNLNNIEYTSRDSMFPIFPRKWFELTGRISPYQQSDTYLNVIAKNLGIFKFEPRIEHEHGEVGILTENRINDEVTQEIKYMDSIPFHEATRDLHLIQDHMNMTQSVIPVLSWSIKKK